jgi:hypothetical protein
VIVNFKKKAETFLYYVPHFKLCRSSFKFQICVLRRELGVAESQLRFVGKSVFFPLSKFTAGVENLVVTLLTFPRNNLRNFTPAYIYTAVRKYVITVYNESIIEAFMVTFLGAFAKLRKYTISFVMSVLSSICPSVLPSVRSRDTTRLVLE